MQAPAQIERIRQFTKDIEQAAAVGEWERAAQLASERSPLLMSLSAQQSTGALATLREIQAIDLRVAEAAQAAQETLTAEYRTAMQAARNANQYQRIAQF